MPEKEANTCLRMNREMLPCKLLFFVMDIAMSCISTFLSLYYIEAGLTVDKLGLSSSVGSIMSLFIFPMWGMFMDSLKKNRILFITVMLLLATGVEFSKPWVVMLVSKYRAETKCHNVTINSTHPADTMYNTSSLQQYYHTFDRAMQPSYSVLSSGGVPGLSLQLIDKSQSFSMNKNSNVTSNITYKEVCTTKQKLLNADTLFYAVTANGLLSSLLFAAMMAYTEAAIIKTIFTREKTQSYGEQKVFGPIGSSLGALMAGVAVDHFHPKHMSKYLICFFMYVPLSLLQLPLLYIITKQADWEYGTRKKDEKKVSAMKHVYNAFKKLDNLVFLVSVLFSGTSLCVYFHYLFIYVDSTMHPTKTMLSLSSVVSMASELVIYPISSKLIKLVGGRMRCVVIGIASTALRLWLLCQCTEAWHILLIQPLNGLGISLGWTAMIEHSWAIFPKEITTTAIGILVSFHWIGPGIAVNIIGGQLYRKYGGPPLFKGMCYIASSWCVLMLIYIACRRPEETPSAKEAVKEEKEKEKETEKKEDSQEKEMGMYKDVELEDKDLEDRVRRRTLSIVK